MVVQGQILLLDGEDHSVGGVAVLAKNKKCEDVCSTDANQLAHCKKYALISVRACAPKVTVSNSISMGRGG